MNDTPRTDKHMEAFNAGWSRCPIMPDFARVLERENNQLRTKCEALENAGHIFLDALKHGGYGMGDAERAFRATVEQPGMNTSLADKCEELSPKFSPKVALTP